MGFSSMFSHAFLHKRLMDVLLTRIIKGKFHDASVGFNYRPIAFPAAASKRLEVVLRQIFESFLQVSPLTLASKLAIVLTLQSPVSKKL